MTKLEPGNENVPAQIRVRIPPNLPTAYANVVRIAHTPAEIMFDFARILPGDKDAEVVSRVLMSPLGAKLLLRALNENLAKFEATYGEINIPQKQSLADYLFRPPQPPEDPKDDNNG
jgi:hypothetical protein